MKKTILTILLCSILIIFLTGCSKNEKLEKPYIGEESTTKIATDREIELSIKEGTLTDAGATIVFTNNSDKDYKYSVPFSVEVKEDGKWHVIHADMSFNLPAFTIKAGEIKEMEITWEPGYGELENGTYRVIKNISYEYEKDKYEDFNIAVEFNIDKD